MKIFNTVWGVIALAVIAGIVFVQAGKGAPGIGVENSGGAQTAKILGAAGDSLSGLISAIETGKKPAQKSTGWWP